MSQDRIQELEQQITKNQELLEKSKQAVSKFDPDDDPSLLTAEGGRQKILTETIAKLTAELNMLHKQN